MRQETGGDEGEEGDAYDAKLGKDEEKRLGDEAGFRGVRGVGNAGANGEGEEEEEGGDKEGVEGDRAERRRAAEEHTAADQTSKHQTEEHRPCFPIIREQKKKKRRMECSAFSRVLFVIGGVRWGLTL